jgi:hypothetical protein
MPFTSLIVEMGSRSRPFDFHVEVIRVGHGEDCELVLPFDWVYPEHFAVQWRAGAAYARAISGQTLLNSRPLTADWAAIHLGDELRIPSPAGKPISVVVTQLGGPAVVPAAPAALVRPDEVVADPGGPHSADSHMAAIAAVTVGVLLVGIGLAVYVALTTTARPIRLTAAPASDISILTSQNPDPATSSVPAPASEISDLKSQIPAPAPPVQAPVPEISNLKPEIPDPPLSAAAPPIVNRAEGLSAAKTRIENESLTSALAARQAHRDSAAVLLTTAPHLPEPMRGEIVEAVLARLGQDVGPSAVAIDPSATVQGDGQTAVLRGPITINNARGASYRTQVVALLSPTANGWAILYHELR